MATIRERRPGVYQLRVSAGSDPIDGKRLTITETFHGTEAAARKRLGDLETDSRRNNRDHTHLTLKAAIAAWRAKARHTPGTIRNYDLAAASIPPHFLKQPIGKIRAHTIEDLEARIVAELGVHRARLVHAVISGALQHAWRQEWLRDNVARRVEPPAQPHRKQTSPSVAEVQRLLKLVVARPELYAWLLLSVMVGGRRSEILALRWSDIDLDTGTVTIDKALDPVGGGVKLTKSENERTVAIGPVVVGALLAWREAFYTREIPTVADPYVFARALDGSTPWRPDTATKRFGVLRDKAQVNCRLHDCRHMVANTLLTQGVSARMVADRLGHTRVQTTQDLYGKSMPATDREAADVMEAALSAVGQTTH